MAAAAAANISSGSGRRLLPEGWLWQQWQESGRGIMLHEPVEFQYLPADDPALGDETLGTRFGPRCGVAVREKRCHRCTHSPSAGEIGGRCGLRVMRVAGWETCFVLVYSVRCLVSCVWVKQPVGGTPWVPDERCLDVRGFAVGCEFQISSFEFPFVMSGFPGLSMSLTRWSSAELCVISAGNVNVDSVRDAAAPNEKSTRMAGSGGGSAGNAGQLDVEVQGLARQRMIGIQGHRFLIHPRDPDHE